MNKHLPFFLTLLILIAALLVSAVAVVVHIAEREPEETRADFEAGFKGV